LEKSGKSRTKLMKIGEKWKIQEEVKGEQGFFALEGGFAEDPRMGFLGAFLGPFLGSFLPPFPNSG
jgi:hypothetical protein